MPSQWIQATMFATQPEYVTPLLDTGGKGAPQNAPKDEQARYCRACGIAHGRKSAYCGNGCRGAHHRTLKAYLVGKIHAYVEYSQRTGKRVDVTRY